MRYLKSIFIAKMLLFAFLLATYSEQTYAQSTLFNIPSTDVVAKKDVYVEFDFLAHLESYNKGGFQTYVPRAVFGVGKKVEVGVNVAFTKTSSLQPVEIQPNIKYKFYEGEKNGVSASVGTILYAPITKRTGTDTFGFFYGNVSKQVTGKYGPRLTGGVYGLAGRSKGTGTKGGAMVGYEQPISSKVKFVTDWFSGKNRFGYVTPGLAFTTSKASALYVGYSIGNEGRKNNALFIYYGITF
jgi:hypothetical protein